MKPKRKKSNRRRTIRGTASIHRCASCKHIHLSFGSMTIELDDANFEIFRDMVNEVTLPMRKSAGIWNPQRFHRWKN